MTDIFVERDANTGATYGLLDSTSIEHFMTTLKGKKIGNPLKRKMVIPKVISIVFMNGFYTKSRKLSKARCFLQFVKLADLQPIYNDLNGKEYVPEFYTNDVENINSQIKFKVIDVFILKMKDLIECIDAIYRYIDISMPYVEREILNLLKNSSTSKLEVRGFQWLPKDQTIDICNRY